MPRSHNNPLDGKNNGALSLLLRNRTTIIKKHEKIFGMDLGLPPSPFVFRFCLAAKTTFLGVWLQMRRGLLAS